MPDEPIPMPPPAQKKSGRAGRKGGERADVLEREREIERAEGIAPERRGSAAAPSDRPEHGPPHPQDVNDVSGP